MRILTLGGVDFHTDLRKVGHDVWSIVGPGGKGHPQDIEFDYFLNPSASRGFVQQLVLLLNPGALLLGDDSGPNIHLGLEAIGIPKAWYSIDTHLHGWHRHYAPIFDHVFVAQKNQVDGMRTYARNIEWLPLCTFSDVEFVPWEDRIHQVSFVGKLDRHLNPWRVDLIEGVKARGIDIHVAAGDYVPVFSRSKVVINQAVWYDLNFRFFEAPGCGALLITDDIGHSMEDFLIPGEDYLLYRYRDVDDLCEKIRWALSHDDEIRGMAASAHRKIRSSHRGTHRAGIVSERLKTLRPGADRETARDHLAYAYKLCTYQQGEAGNLPIAACLASYAEETASRNVSAEGEFPWSRLVLAMAANERRHGKEALDHLSALEGDAEDREFSFHRGVERVVAHLSLGDGEEARTILREFLARFPENPDLLRLKELAEQVE